MEERSCRIRVAGGQARRLKRGTTTACSGDSPGGQRRHGRLGVRAVAVSAGGMREAWCARPAKWTQLDSLRWLGGAAGHVASSETHATSRWNKSRRHMRAQAEDLRAESVQDAARGQPANDNLLHLAAVLTTTNAPYPIRGARRSNTVPARRGAQRWCVDRTNAVGQLARLRPVWVECSTVILSRSAPGPSGGRNADPASGFVLMAGTAACRGWSWTSTEPSRRGQRVPPPRSGSGFSTSSVKSYAQALAAMVEFLWRPT